MSKYIMTFEVATDVPNEDGSSTEHYNIGSKFETDNPCEMLSFLRRVESVDTNSTVTSIGNTIENLRKDAEIQGCLSDDGTTPTDVTIQDGIHVSPNDGDTPEAQGDIEQESNSISRTREAGYNGTDGETPTDALNDPENPASLPEVTEGLQNQGLSPTDAENAAREAERGNNPDGEERSTHTGERSQGDTQGGDPIQLYSGKLTLRSVDLDIPNSFMSLQFIRYYLSGRPYYGPFGYNWDHNWNVYLRELNNGSIARWSGELHEDIFHFNGTEFDPPPGIFEQLEQRIDHYIILAKGGNTLRFERPPGWSEPQRIPLVMISDRSGNQINLTYDSNNKLQFVTDSDNRFFQFHYGNCGLLESVEDHNHRIVEYGHDQFAEHLVSVRMTPTKDQPTGALTCYSYSSTAHHIALRHNIVSVQDNDGNTVLLNHYNEDPRSPSFNRIERQYVGGHAYHFCYESIQWVPQDAVFINIIATRTAVWHPDGTLWTYSFNYRGDLIDDRFRLNHDGSYRIVSTQRTFDDQGNLTRITRSNGSMTEWTWDHENPDPRARSNLLRVELRSGGLAPLPSRIIFRAHYENKFQQIRTIVYETGAQVQHWYDFDLTPGNPANKGDLLRVDWPNVTLPDGTPQSASTKFQWNERGQISALISPTGIRREFIYEPTGSLLAGFLREKHEDVGGVHEITFYDYDTFGYLSSQTTPGGHVWGFRYDTIGRLIEHHRPEINGSTDPIKYQYNGSSRIVRVERPKGDFKDGVTTGNSIIDTYKIDPAGVLQELVIGANTASPRPWKLQSDWAGRPCRITDPLGIVTERRWDERGLMLKEVRASGTTDEQTFNWFYDDIGQLFRREEPGGATSLLKYDPWGRQVEITYPNGSHGVNLWGNFDLLIGQELFGNPGDGEPDRLLRKASYTYDERGRIQRYTEHSFTNDPSSPVLLSMEKWYDEDGRVTHRISPTGGIFILKHDGLGRITHSEDPLGNSRSFSYSADGLVSQIKETDVGPNGLKSRSSEFRHDSRGRLIQTIHPSGAIYLERFDARDLPVESMNPFGTLARRSFGLLGELEELRFDIDGAAPISYKHDYDLIGREIAFTDPTEEQTKVQRDALGREVLINLADGSQIRRSFNIAGKLAKEVTADGSVVNYQYDNANRLSRVATTPSIDRLPLSDHIYKYDGANRLVSVSNDSTSSTRAYDSLDRVWRESTDEHVFEREFNDLAGEFLFRYPDGRTERHHLDQLGRVERINLEAIGSSNLGPLSGNPDTELLKIQFFGTSRVAKIDHGNGVSSDWRHDDDGRIIRVSHETSDGSQLESTRYRYDKFNRRRVRQLLGSPQSNTLYRYDNRGRLIENHSNFNLNALSDANSQTIQDSDISLAEINAASASVVQTWLVDDSDTRQSERTLDTGTPITKSYTASAGHKITKIDTNTLTYDPDGRRLSDVTRTYKYDALGRVSLIKDASTNKTIATLKYDAFGRWSGGMVGGTMVHKSNFELDCVQEEDESGQLLRQQLYVPGMLLPMVETNTQGVHHLHFDGAQSILLVTDNNGAAEERYRYSSFGSVAVFDGAGNIKLSKSAIDIKPRFGGMPFEHNIALYFTPARLYDPEYGIFLSRDPFLHFQSPSPYTYALHDPINVIDPDGHLPPLIVAGLIVGGIGALIGAGSVMLSDEDYDAWDVLAGATIGFGAGFIGGVTFSWAAGAIGGGLLTAAGGSATVAETAGLGTAINVLSGVGAGGTSGLASGLFSGFSNGVYHGGIRGRGDTMQMIGEGMYREGVSGLAAGMVGGGLFQGSLLAGRPGVAWSALRSSFGGGNPARVIGRGLLSPYGLGGAGAGFGSGMTGGVVRNMLDGDDFSTAVSESWGEGLFSAAAGGLTTAMHPVSYQFWRTRLSPRYAASIESTRPGGTHHQRSVAQYPEYATRRDQPRAPHDFLDRLVNSTTRGNITGAQSEYNLPNNPLSHQQMHNQWRFGQGGNWTNVPTHGPWTPAWNPNYTWPNSLPQNQSDKEQ